MAMTLSPTKTSDLSVTSKVGQINQRLKGWEAVRWVDGRPQVTDVLRAEIDRLGGIGALYGVLRADPWSAVRWGTGIPPERSAEAYAAVQECVTSRGDGMPVLFVEEAPHGLMALGGTTLPVNLALGAGMDADLARELGAAVAAEARERGTHLLLVSGLDVLRDARWGRSEECFSEDPAIAALLVEATVQGMQGAGPGERIDARHVAVVAKHLAGQGAGIGGRNGSGAPIGRRELGEIHLRPAFAAARAGVAGFMSAYNDVDGVPCTGSRELLTGTLREDWGWDGIVMSDGGAIDRLTLATGGGLEGAAALALGAGVDLSLWDQAYLHVASAIEKGLIEAAALDLAVSRVLALKQRLGLLPDEDGSEQPISADAPSGAAAPAGADAPAGDDERAWPSPAARETIALAERAARQAVVVLEDGDLLPLSARKVAVVGPNADDLDAQLGDYTPPRPPQDPAASTIRSALIERLGAQNVTFARGSALRSELVPVELSPQWKDAADPIAEVAAAMPLTAVTSLTMNADAAIVVLGGTSRRSYEDEFADNGAVEGPASDTTNGEGVDLASVALPEPQLAVVRAAREAGKPVIAVVVDGRPRALTALRELADATILAPFPGPAAGRAIVDALYGEGGPRGLLPMTLPAGDGATPVSHDQRLEAARGYLDLREVRGPLLGAGLPRGITCQVAAGGIAVPPGAADPAGAPEAAGVTSADQARDGVVPISVPALEDGRPAQVTVQVESVREDTVSVPVVLYGRRHELGIVPRARTVLAVRRVEVEPGRSAVTFDLGADALGSWASGRPRAVPAEIEIWAEPQLAPPADAPRIRVTA
ncbi:beta-glucosidase [Brachybacterium phenoliresistens]|uniref:Beta-glucosidase n=1 Tax=Brachybacterium phenoliresistens TaxID=396014 RepID=Z9JX16_9MICO|nr:glycoside hydrolase family 3 N-terminal domain-containing protein [Brachybacterium phenoliresistens]EWS82351.1 beta-glucosidase [Brachybacterium phenoliresistens]